MIGGPPPDVPRRPCPRQGPDLHIFTEELCEDKCASGELIGLIGCVLTLQDSRFNAEVDLITGYKTHSILCLPIKNHRDEVSRLRSFQRADARGVTQTLRRLMKRPAVAAAASSARRRRASRRF